MANDLITLADLQKINDQNLADIEVTDLLQRAPLFAALAAGESSNGTQHKYTKETGAPVVGFRAANTGRDHGKSQDTLVTINLKILDASFHVDKAIADKFGKGPEAYIEREGMRHLKAAFFKGEQQFINGIAGDADGFTGFVDADTIDGLDDEMVIDGGGAGDADAELTSIFMLRTVNDDTDVMAITDTNIEMDETVVQFMPDGDGKLFPTYATPITGWLGLQIGSKFSIGRIPNINVAKGATERVTDDLISRLAEQFPSGHEPNLIVMHRKARGQLKRSRTATTVTGVAAETPKDWEGIPIITTDGLSLAETAVTLPA